MNRIKFLAMSIETERLALPASQEFRVTNIAGSASSNLESRCSRHNHNGDEPSCK